MAMDFFEHQERARKQTGRLVLLYGLAVVGIIVLVYVAVTTLVVFTGSRHDPTAQPDLWAPDLLLWIGGGTIVLVGLASLAKISELGAGGSVVAEALGGRLLNTGTRDETDRKVLNVVEEMSIASGVPVPAVYLLDGESRINAFAAGHKPEHAVVGITRGAAETLSRDELQGVVAHEFSHILNGDMRLNIRLIGILHGILVIGLLGGMLARVAIYGGGRSSRRGGGAGGMMALGVALFLIGYIGVFFGRLIKAAVSRQREFLADASAVNFTRNADGIGGALRKIGGSSGAYLRSPKAEQFSHMYFGQGVRSLWSAFATHPRLPERIRRIDPRWDGTFPSVVPPSRVQKPRVPREPAKPRAAAAAMPMVAALAATAVAQVGRPTEKHLEYARALLDRIPDELAKAVHEPLGARAVVYCLVLDRDEASRKRQWERLDRHAKDVAGRARELAPLVEKCGPEARIPLLDLATPALRELTRLEYAAFKDDFVALSGADRRIDTFEWLLRRVILLYLEPHFTKTTRPVVQYYNLRGVRRELAVLLSTLAREGHAGEQDAKRAFELGRMRLKGVDAEKVPYLEAEECGLRALDGALDKLATVTPRRKRTILEAAGTCIAADQQVTVEEGELFRGIADVLDCPMPPLLPGQPLA